MDSDIKKKRGRKPKNFYNEEIKEEIVEKKKRGRKKKYEIENFDKILNRDRLNNFDHNIAYSDDEEIKETNNESVKKISFGNLDITVSKKTTTCPEIYRNEIIEKTKNTIINQNEWESDEEKEIPIESIIPVKVQEFKRYIPGNMVNCLEKYDSDIKKLRVVKTIKNVLNTDTWPDSTDICCWWCCHKFENSPCTLPIKYESITKKFSFVGIFCSWNCVKTYNIEKNDSKVYQRSELITFVIQQIYGILEAISIKNAPPRQCLKMFGGYLDILEFRESFRTVQSYKMNLFNYVFIHPQINETYSINVKPEKKNLRISRC
jgi:hypothetical protein